LQSHGALGYLPYVITQCYRPPDEGKRDPS